MDGRKDGRTRRSKRRPLIFPIRLPPPPPPPHPHRPGALINPQWLELPMSRINFHSPKDVRAFEVRLYVTVCDKDRNFWTSPLHVGRRGLGADIFLFVYTINYVQYAEYRFTCNEQQRLRSHLGDVSSICGIT